MDDLEKLTRVADATTFSIFIEASTFGIRILLIKHHEFGGVARAFFLQASTRFNAL